MAVTHDYPLEHGSHLLRELVHDLPVPAALLSVAGTILEINDAAALLWGVAASVLPGQAIHHVAWWRFDSVARERLHRALQEARHGGIVSYEEHVVTPLGRSVELGCRLAPVRAQDGTVLRVLLSLVERPARPERQASLDTSEQWLADLARQVSTVFWVSDGGFREILYVSPAYERVWKRSRDSLYANPGSFLDAIHPDDRPQVRRMMARRHEGEGELEYRVVRPDGTTAWVHDRGAAIGGTGGGPRRLAGLATDVTSHKRLEERLRQAVQLEAIGRLASGVAHDFNNVLAVILSQVELAIAGLGMSDWLREDLEQIRAAATAGAALPRQLLAFAGKQVLEPALVDLNAAVTDMQRMLRRVLGADLELVVELSADVPPVWADAGQLQQVLFNLVINAREAMPAGGRLTVTTAPLHLETSLTSSIPGHQFVLPPGEYVRLSLRDTGTGIAADVLPHLFEPFFSTKRRSGGLGLATCLDIVRQCGGAIRVESEPGQGSRFDVLLPTVNGQAAPA